MTAGIFPAAMVGIRNSAASVVALPPLSPRRNCFVVTVTVSTGRISMRACAWTLCGVRNTIIPTTRAWQQMVLAIIRCLQSYSVRLTRYRWNFSVILDGIIPSNPLACWGTIREMRSHWRFDTEWQRVGNQINAAMIFVRADFINVDGLQSCSHRIIRDQNSSTHVSDSA